MRGTAVEALGSAAALVEEWLVLLKQATLEALREGRLDTVYRWWASPRVRAGTHLRTAIGLVEVLAIEPLHCQVCELRLTRQEVRRAGFASADALRGDLLKQATLSGKSRTLFRIRLRPSGPDPRLALREDTNLDQETMSALVEQVLRLGRRSADGAWGLPLLEQIAACPATRAAELACAAQMPVRTFKARVRQLKELGLTESLGVGYRLSPRGEVLLARLAEL